MRKPKGRFAALESSLFDNEAYLVLPGAVRGLYADLCILSARAGFKPDILRIQVTRLGAHNNVKKSLKTLADVGLIRLEDSKIILLDPDTAEISNRYGDDKQPISNRYTTDKQLISGEKKAPENNEVRPLEIEVEKELELNTPPNPPMGESGELFEKPPDKLEGPKAAKVPTAEINQVEETFIAELQTLRRSQGRQVPRKRRLAEDERKTVAKAIKSVGVEDACAAVRGMFKTPHNLGQNDRETEYLSIAIALRPSNLDRFIGKGAQERKPICTGDFGQPIFHDTPDADLTRTERKRKQEALQNDVVC